LEEKTIEIEIPVLLPGVQDKQDQCIVRLENALQGHRGVHKAHLERDKDPIRLCLHYDPDFISLEEIQRTSRRAGAKIINRYRHEIVPIAGMDCSDCALVVEHSVNRLDGVINANVSYAAQTMLVEYDSHQTNRRAINLRVHHLGYSVPVHGTRGWFLKNRELLSSLLAGILLGIGWVGEHFLGFPTSLSIILYAVAYLTAGYDVTRHALGALRQRHFDTDFLMVVAALGAAVLGDFAEGALLLFLFSLGHSLEERALDRTRHAIRSLATLAPTKATVRKDGQEHEIPVEELKIGDMVIVRPGSQLPVDGEVLSGKSSVDQSPVTGESNPMRKQSGDSVYAGSVNGEGALEIKVTRLSRDSTLARVIKMVENAQTQKSPTQLFTDKFTRFFVPVVLVGDLLLILVPPIFGVPFHVTFLRAMTLLVAASPCALALGTPATILTGIAQAARNGVLVKSGAHLETLGRLKAIAFDKTGTITLGQPAVTDLWIANTEALFFLNKRLNLDDEDQNPEAILLKLAAAVENRSQHPLGLAVVKEARDRKLNLPNARDAHNLDGRGIEAEVEGVRVRLGSLGWFDAAGSNVSPEFQQRVKSLEEQGKTSVLVSVNDSLLGLIGIADVLRPGVNQVLNDLRSIGVQDFIMLTGDNPKVAAEIARQANLTDIRAGLLPQDKLEAVRSLLQQYKYVGMVGDGVNDAPALANASVGIAMGGAGTDVALETADVALMADDLSRLPFAIGLGRATRLVIFQNLVIAMGVITGLVIFSLSGSANIGAAIIFHEGSTLLVVLNALKLLRYKTS
jgi:Cd2+/Zn2+-exporting ATPase